MTKEEAIKIFSAYLPYGLEVQVYFDDPDHNRIVTMCAIDTDEIYTYSNKPESWYISGRDEEYNMRGNYGALEIKPILWDLSYLTNPITHNGETFTMMDKLYKLRPFECTYQEMADHLSTLGIDEMNYWLYEQLVKHHFNVFNLPEDQYINKATLKQ